MHRRAEEGIDAVVRGTIRASGIAKGRRPTLIVKVDDGTGLVTLRFFHFRRAQALQLKVGDTITLFRQPRLVGGAPEFAHPEYAVGEREPQLEEALTQSIRLPRVGSVHHAQLDATSPHLSNSKPT